jgi:hypothetical protein
LTPGARAICAGRDEALSSELREVAATLALIFSLAGGAYAAGLGKNDVKTKNIAPKAVKAPKIATSAVTNPKLAPNAVTGAKVADGTLSAADLAAGAISTGAGAGGVQPAAYSPSFDIRTVTLTTTRPGRLFVSGFVSGSLSCPTGTCTDTYGLFVDTVPVPGSGSVLTLTSPAIPVTEDMTLMGVTSAPVPAGTHTIQLNFTQSGGANGSSQRNDSKVAAVLLGP